MAGPTFSKQISLGSMIQLVVLMVTVILGWSRLDNRVENNRAAIATEIEARKEIVQRLRRAETEITRSDERFTRIIELLARINNRLDVIERRSFQGRQ